MKIRRLIVFLLVFSMLIPFAPALPQVSALTIEDFSDVDPNGWAYEYLTRAVNEGLLNGSGPEDAPRLNPMGNLTVAEMAAVLTRVLQAQTVDQPYPGTSPGFWYYESAAQAMALGLLPEDGSWGINDKVTRAQVFLAMARAFELLREPQDLSVLEPFWDIVDQSLSIRRAAAALVENGILLGSSNSNLMPEKQITRQEFAAMVCRAYAARVNGEDLPLETEGTYLCGSETVALSQIEVPQDLYLTAPVKTVTLSDVTFSDTLTIRSAQLDTLSLENVVLPRLVLGNTGGDLTVAPSGGTLDTLVIGQNKNAVSFTGTCNRVEITGNGQTIFLSGNITEVAISGTGNIVTIAPDVLLSSLTFGMGSMNNQVILDGNATSVEVHGSGQTLSGTGSVETVTLYEEGNTISVTVGNTLDEIDYGLDGVIISYSGVNPIPAGGNLKITATISGVQQDRIVMAQWWRDGNRVTGYDNEAFELKNGKTSTLNGIITFTKDMALSTEVGLELIYDNPASGERERIFTTTTVTIENYPASHYDPMPSVEEVLKKVSNVYRGDYTINYNPDYTTKEKEVFVNQAKNYSSSTRYLVWVNIGTQKVNVFTGSKGNWTLICTFRCGTGRPGYDTRQGVTYVTGKQDRWNIPGKYSCGPIVRFYPGSGYAFHSRLYYPAPRQTVLKDARIGFPISDGCVRMYDEDIQWLHKNVPLYSTVVIY